MLRSKQYTVSAAFVGAFCLLGLPAAVRAQVSTPTVTQSNGLFHYNYSIANTTTNDLFDVDIHVSTGPGMVTNIIAPTGFMTKYDTGLGLVSFLEDTGTFTSTPQSGFSFDSAFGPRASAADSQFYDAANNVIITTSNSTLAPIATAVPEPGSVALIGALGFMAAGVLRRARRR